MRFRYYSKKYIAEFVYGATDGTVTTFAIISGVMGAALSPIVIIVLGLASVLADGFSMASSNYLSQRSDRAINGDGGGAYKQPINTAVITFSSFVLIGIIPLVPFVAGVWLESAVETQFLLSGLFTFIAFVLIGLVRGYVTNKPRSRTVAETLLIGGGAAVIAFAIGFLLRGVA